MALSITPRRQDQFTGAAVAVATRGGVNQSLGVGTFPPSPNTTENTITYPNATDYTERGIDSVSFAAVLNNPTYNIINFLASGIGTVTQFAGAATASQLTQTISSPIADTAYQLTVSATDDAHHVTAIGTGMLATGPTTPMEASNYNIYKIGGSFFVVFESIPANTVRAVITYSAYQHRTGFEIAFAAGSQSGDAFDMSLYYEERRGDEYERLQLRYPNCRVSGAINIADGSDTTTLTVQATIEAQANTAGQLYLMSRRTYSESIIEFVENAY